MLVLELLYRHHHRRPLVVERRKILICLIPVKLIQLIIYLGIYLIVIHHWLFGKGKHCEGTEILSIRFWRFSVKQEHASHHNICVLCLAHRLKTAKNRHLTHRLLEAFLNCLQTLKSMRLLLIPNFIKNTRNALVKSY